MEDKALNGSTQQKEGPNPDSQEEKMDVQISGSYEPINEAELAQFERELRAALPQDYRQFLLHHNGGEPEPSMFDVDMHGFKNSSLVLHFLGIRETEQYDLFTYFRGYQEFMPQNLLAIATALAEHLVCLSVSGDDYGKVYFWDADWAIQEGKPRYHNVHLVADSFTEFLDKLYYEEYG